MTSLKCNDKLLDVCNECQVWVSYWTTVDVVDISSVFSIESPAAELGLAAGGVM